MDLTTEALSGFVGGQIEIQNKIERYLFRGEVEAIRVEDGKINVKFVWLAKGVGYPPFPERWVADEELDYAIDLQLVTVVPRKDASVVLQVRIIGELAIFFSPEGSKLDPERVEGLVLNSG